MAKRKKNYLNNRDMLAEIHKSKISYCSFLDPLTDSQQDYIVDSKEEIFETKHVEVGKDENGNVIFDDVPVIDLARQARATRLTKLDIPTDVNDVKNTDIVFRVMTTEHIPLVPKKKAKKKAAPKKDVVSELFDEFDDDGVLIEPKVSQADQEDVEMVPMRAKFPPFFHYRLNDDNTLKLIGKSHWRGTLEDGEFCMDHGKTTDTLAMMYMKLCERYATRSNWRGYCITDDVEALTQRGWLTEDQITEDDTILSYDDGNMKWSNIKSIYRGEYDGLMHYLTQMNMDSLMTPNHKLVTERGLIPVEHILGSDRVILMGEAEAGPTNKLYSDSFVELLGWIVTDGCYQIPKKSIQIYQNEGPYSDRIRNCLNELKYEFTEKFHKGRNICFSLRRPACLEIFKIFPEKNLTMDFILKLTQDQRELLIETMIDADGHRISKYNTISCRYDQKCNKHMDLFQALCTLSGLRTHNHKREMKSYNKIDYTTMNRLTILSKKKHTSKGSSFNFHGGRIKNRGVNIKNKHKHPNEPTTYYKGTVWCPETEYGCFVARRNGKVYLTGNTYNDEMRGQALLQLSQIGLQFNEAKSQNPFAYYTAAVTNSFTRILNIEKKMQNIRDDILEANGLTPSWTRQFANDNSDQKYIDNPDD